jgi:hypothetical protein
MCQEWGATKKWDLDYLIEEAGDQTSSLSYVARKDSEIPWNRVAAHPALSKRTLEDSIGMVKNNTISSSEIHAPYTSYILYFVDRDLLRSASLREDYTFP